MIPFIRTNRSDARTAKRIENDKQCTSIQVAHIESIENSQSLATNRYNQL